VLLLQVLMWGIDDADLFHPPSMLSSRFPQFHLWTKVSPERPDYLLTNAMIIVETIGDHLVSSCEQQSIHGLLVAGTNTYDVPPR
jgi:hypothetical protein